MSLTIGDRFPAVAVYGPRGPVALSDRWADGPLVVAFHRLWCPFCQQAAKELQAHRGEITAAGGDAVLIYRDGAAEVGRTCHERGIAFDCLSDPQRELEEAAQIGRINALRYAAFSPLKLLRALRSGARPGPIRTDLLRGRGTYVVDANGRVAYAHVSSNAADIPPIGDVVAAVLKTGKPQPPASARAAVDA